MAAQALAYGGLAGLQLAGGYFASQNIKQTAALNTEIANMNAQFAELDAFDSLAKGQTNQARYQTVIDNTLSEQTAILAASGVDTSFGSAASIQEETKFTADLNLMEIEKRAQEEALGYKRQARDFRTSGVLQESQADVKARQVLFQSGVGAVSTGLSGYSRFGGGTSPKRRSGFSENLETADVR